MAPLSELPYLIPVVWLLPSISVLYYVYLWEHTGVYVRVYIFTAHTNACMCVYGSVHHTRTYVRMCVGVYVCKVCMKLRERTYIRIDLHIRWLVTHAYTQTEREMNVNIRTYTQAGFILNNVTMHHSCITDMYTYLCMNTHNTPKFTPKYSHTYLRAYM